jgi:molecular chaperone GrpE
MKLTMDEQKNILDNSENEKLDETNNNITENNTIEIEGKPVAEVSPSDQLNQSLAKISELEEKVKLLQDALLRKAAEFENYKRRSENDQLNLIKYAAEPFIISVLSVYDDLERSLNHINDDKSFESLQKGLELVSDKFSKILNQFGIKKIDAKGKPFDVENHEALMQQPSNNFPPHTVIDVIEPGYIYKDKVIRHAKVIVSSELNIEDVDNSAKDDSK